MLRHQGRTPPYLEKYGALHGLERATAGSYNPTKFSVVRAVARRNSLYQILETSVALGRRLRAKSSSEALIYVPGWGREGKLATVNFVEFLFPRTPVNRARERGLLELGHPHAVPRRCCGACSLARSTEVC
jgi:hypothetical protein